MSYNQSLPYTYQSLPNMQPQMMQQPQIMPDYRGFPFERLSSIIGQTYNLSSLESINTIPLPRGTDQQIFLVNNSEKIYARQSDNTIGVIGYKQDYVQELTNNLMQAQQQLHEIFEQVSKESEANEATEQSTPKEDPTEKRFSEIENKLNQLMSMMEEKKNGPAKNDKALAAISELA